jgi:hypothetical protein
LLSGIIFFVVIAFRLIFTLLTLHFVLLLRQVLRDLNNLIRALSLICFLIALMLRLLPLVSALRTLEVRVMQFKDVTFIAGLFFLVVRCLIKVPCWLFLS